MIDSLSMAKAALEPWLSSSVLCSQCQLRLAVTGFPKAVVLWLLAAVRSQIDFRLYDFVQPISFFPGHWLLRFQQGALAEGYDIAIL